jgi:hypothetical protein
MIRWLASSLALPLVLGAPIVLAGCPRSSPDVATDAATPAPSASAANADAGPTASASASAKNASKRPSNAKPTAPSIPAKDRREAVKALEEGRKLSRAKDYKAAIAAFDRALAIDPGNAKVLSEVGWAALQANDLARAEDANTKALASTHDTNLRAMILYNQGRVFEAKNEKAKAIALYDKSLALRDNPEVASRRKSLEAKAPPPAPPVPCASPVADVGALCTCLFGDKTDYLGSGANPACEAEKDVPPLGDPRLSVVKWSGGDMAETAHMLALSDEKGVRVLADLGHDYEPGAFGVHNTSEVKGGDAKTVNGKSVVVVRSEENDNDFNMAGLELCSQTQKWETVCKLAAPATCVPVAVSTISGCGVGVEPDPKDLDDETKKALADIKAHATTQHAETSWTIGDDGKLVVRLIPGGTSDLVLKGMLGSHPLF